MKYDKMNLKGRCSKCFKVLLIPKFTITFEGLTYHRQCFNTIFKNNEYKKSVRKNKRNGE